MGKNSYTKLIETLIEAGISAAIIRYTEPVYRTYKFVAPFVIRNRQKINYWVQVIYFAYVIAVNVVVFTVIAVTLVDTFFESFYPSGVLHSGVIKSPAETLYAWKTVIDQVANTNLPCFEDLQVTQQASTCNSQSADYELTVNKELSSHSSTESEKVNNSSKKGVEEKETPVVAIIVVFGTLIWCVLYIVLHRKK